MHPAPHLRRVERSGYLLLVIRFVNCLDFAVGCAVFKCFAGRLEIGDWKALCYRRFYS